MRWTLRLDWLFLRASSSKTRCKVIDPTPKPTRPHHPRPDSRARPEVAAHGARREKMATNAVASYEMRLEPQDRTKRMELVSSSTTDDATTDFTCRSF